ncbi:MAG: hypothetical protein QOD03_337 [Verrucomicrobiota bacterium]|jgi:hypothetical protein
MPRGAAALPSTKVFGRRTTQRAQAQAVVYRAVLAPALNPTEDYEPSGDLLHSE